MAEIEDLIQQGDENFSEGKYKEARDYFEQALAGDGQNGYLYMMVGETYRLEKNYEQAIANFENALDKDPDNPDYLNRLGLSLASLEKYNEAIEKYKKALGKDKDYYYAHYNLGIALYNQEKYDQAIRSLKKALKIQPESVNAHYYWGESLRAQEKYDEAIKKYQDAIEINPDLPGNYNVWGLALAAQGQYEEAIEKYKDAVNVDPNYIYAHRNWGESLRSLSRYDEAIERYKKVLEIDPDNADANNIYGLALTAQKKYDEAVKKYQRALEINPSYVYALRNWGDALYDQKLFEEAIDRYKEAINADPGYKYSYRNLGIALSSIKRFDEAIQYYEKALEIDPEYADIYNDWGNALYDQGLFEDAIQQYEKALEMDSEHKYAVRNWGRALHDLKLYDESIERYKKAIEIDPEYVHAYNDWGNVLYDQKKYSDAIIKYEQTVEIDPTYSHAWRNWGLALTEKKLYDESILKINKAIEVDPNFAIAWDSLGYSLQRQGRYREARRAYSNAVKAYEAQVVNSSIDTDAELYYSIGNIKASILKNFQQAADAYIEGLKINSEHTRILSNLVDLYLEQKEDFLYAGGESAQSSVSIHWKARDAYHKAKEILSKQLSDNENLDTLVELGELHLNMGEFEAAEEILLKAIKQDDNPAYLHAELGVVLMRKEKYKEAIRYFQAAITRDSDELSYISNLAEAYLKAKMLDLAEAEYRGVLRIVPNHLDSIIGLAEVYTALGDNPKEGGLGVDAEEMYLLAVEQYNRAIKLSETEDASKKFKPSELASIYYSRGYARVALYDSQSKKDDSLLRRARTDFARIPEVDRNYHRARRAIAKISDQLNLFSSRSLEQRVGPIAFITLVLIIFITWQVFFFVGKPTLNNATYLVTDQLVGKLGELNVPQEVLEGLQVIENREFISEDNFIRALRSEVGEDAARDFETLILEETVSARRVWTLEPIEPGYYALVTFGSLIFMIAGLYLQQISRLKFAGIEIEKSSVDQISKSSSLGIRRYETDRIQFSQSASGKISKS